MQLVPIKDKNLERFKIEKEASVIEFQERQRCLPEPCPTEERTKQYEKLQESIIALRIIIKVRDHIDHVRSRNLERQGFQRWAAVGIICCIVAIAWLFLASPNPS